MELAKRPEKAELQPPLHVVIDAHTVFSAVTAEGISTPNENTLLYHRACLRGHLDDGRIAMLHRLDTREMLADDLTKGAVYRSVVLQAFAAGDWRLLQLDQQHYWPQARI